MDRMEDASSRVTPARTGLRISVRRRDSWFLAVAVLIIGLDQLTKWIIRSNITRGDSWPNAGWPIRLVDYRNTGAAFGMLQDAGPLLVVTSLIGMAAILVYLFNPGFAHPLTRLGLAMMFGGAVGNLIDRLWNGEVVDFLHVPDFPAFNIADSAISIGVVLLLWAMLKEPSANPSGEST